MSEMIKAVTAPTKTIPSTKGITKSLGILMEMKSIWIVPTAMIAEIITINTCQDFLSAFHAS
jgi:hypothetical protein